MSRRWRAPTTGAVSLAATALPSLLLAGRRHELAAAASSAAPGMLTVAVLGQVVALLARSEAWHLSIRAAGGTVERLARPPRLMTATGTAGGMCFAALAVADRLLGAARTAVPIPAVARSEA
jgi:hypothetical protein